MYTQYVNTQNCPHVGQMQTDTAPQTQKSKKNDSWLFCFFFLSSVVWSLNDWNCFCLDKLIVIVYSCNIWCMVSINPDLPTSIFHFCLKMRLLEHCLSVATVTNVPTHFCSKWNWISAGMWIKNTLSYSVEMGHIQWRLSVLQCWFWG